MDQKARLERSSNNPPPNCFIYGVGPAIRVLERMIGHIAPTDIPVLLVGESGTGKEQIALEIHYRSRQCKEAFLKFDCRQIPGQLTPAWLSQHSSWKIGGASKGTIFFQEVGELAPTSQDQLLPLLTGQNTIASDPFQRARMISSTARSLEDEVQDGRFHEELFYTLNGICLLIPSLRNRPEDIVPLVDLFLKKYAAVFSRAVPQLLSSTMDSLLQYTWPGNVRQLESVVRKMMELGDERLALRLFSDVLASTSPIVQPLGARYRARSLREAVREASDNVERDLIVKALAHSQWKQAEAACELEITVGSLRYKMKKLGLTKIGSS